MRRILTILLLLAIAGVTGWTLFSWERTSATTADPWEAIPRQSAAIIAIPEPWRLWDRFSHTSRLWHAFEQLPEASAIGEVMARLHNSVEQDAALRDALAAHPMLLALLRESGTKVGFVASMPMPGGGAMASLAAPLNTDAETLATLAAGRTVTLRLHPDLGTLHAHAASGLLIIAGSEALMDEALLQLQAEPRTDHDPALLAARRTLGAGADAHLLLHTERCLRLLQHWWNPDALASFDLPQGWVALDMSSRPDALLFSGLFEPQAGHERTAAFLAQGQGRSIGERSLPATVSVLRVQHLEAPLQWSVDLLPDGERDDDLAVALLGWVDGGIAVAVQAASENMPERKWAVMRTHDPDAADRALRGLCPEQCDSAVHRSQTMLRIGRGAAHERVLGKAFAFLERPWWTLLGDEVVFSDDQVALRASIDVWNDGGTLAEDARHAAWTRRISESAGYTLRCDVPRARNIIRSGMKDGPATAFDRHDSLWSALGHFSVQLSPGRQGTIHITAGLQHAPLARQGTNTVWATALGRPVRRKPDVVRNHVNNSREVLVQDDDHRLHLLGSNGMLLWSRQLDGPIMGVVHQVDRFKNGKLQLLFNTAAQVYLVDRNGKDVGGTPMRLPASATAPLAVFDYDNDREYRVLVPVADGRILNYALDGVPVKGWEPKSLPKAAEVAIRHVRIKGKDHLLVVDGAGTVRAMDRRGNDRGIPTLELGAVADVIALMPGAELETTAMVWREVGGALHETTLGGQTRRLSPPGSGRDHWLNVDGDGHMSVLRMAGDTISRYRNNSVVFSRHMGDIGGDAHAYALGKGQYAIGVAPAGSGHVVLLDPSGSPMEGTPLPGVVPFSIADLDLDGSFEAITVTPEGTVTAYRVRGLPAAGP